MFKLENNLVGFNVEMACILKVWEEIKMELGLCRKPCRKQICQSRGKRGHPVESLNGRYVLETTSGKCKGNGDCIHTVEAGGARKL